MVALQLRGVQPHHQWGDALYQPTAAFIQPQTETVTLSAIPDFAWGNRGMESMRVWIPRAVA